MSRILKTALVAGLTGLSMGCSEFLVGEKLDSDPNRPTSAEAAQLFTAVQVNSYYVINGHAARVIAMWMQQMAGTDRQYIGYDQYAITEGGLGEFSSAYTGGGLVDLRAIQADAEDNGNRSLAGIAKVWEAVVMSFVADMYGDAPYSEAVSSDGGRGRPTPRRSEPAETTGGPKSPTARIARNRTLSIPSQSPSEIHPRPQRGSPSMHAPSTVPYNARFSRKEGPWPS